MTNKLCRARRSNAIQRSSPNLQQIYPKRLEIQQEDSIEMNFTETASYTCGLSPPIRNLYGDEMRINDLLETLKKIKNMKNEMLENEKHSLNANAPWYQVWFDYKDINGPIGGIKLMENGEIIFIGKNRKERNHIMNLMETVTL